MQRLSFGLLALAYVASSVPVLAVQEPMIEDLHINQIQVIGTHNSYHAGFAPSEMQFMEKMKPELAKAFDYRHSPLSTQLSAGIRQIELDIYADTQGGRFTHPADIDLVAKAGLPPDPEFDPNHLMDKPGFKVIHVQDFDYRSNCQPFTACLGEVLRWSQAHPGHLPIFILIETKETPLKLDIPTQPPEPFTRAVFDALDQEILSVFPRNKIVTPDDVRGNRKSLAEAVGHGGWLTLKQARGKVVFLMDQKKVGPIYLDGHPALKGRLIFTNADPGAPDAAFIEQNEGTPEEIDALVRQGYLIRARTDEDTRQARLNDRHRRDEVLSSGAQLVSTDYPWNERAETGYDVALPDRAVARCNPVLVPAGCVVEQFAPHQ
jgi:hypothetical protein